MGAKENLALVERLQEATRQRDFDTYRSLLADDAVFRMAGVPSALGGTTRGADAVAANNRQATGDGTFEVKDMFADDRHVCVIGKITSTSFPGNAFLKGADKSFSTYECVVYRIADGKIQEATNYVNWLDPYVQVGLVDVGALTS